LKISNCARVFTEFLTKVNAADNMKFGSFVLYLPRSVTNNLRSANPLSKTSAAIDGSAGAANNAVAAPIDLPHKPIVLTFRF